MFAKGCTQINNLLLSKMVIKRESKIKKILRSAEEIRYTKHFEEVLHDRINITEKLVESHLRDPRELLEFRYEEDTHPREKYELLFDMSSEYYLMVVISIGGENRYIYVVTSFVMNKRETKILERGFGNGKEG